MMYRSISMRRPRATYRSIYPARCTRTYIYIYIYVYINFPRSDTFTRTLCGCARACMIYIYIYIYIYTHYIMIYICAYIKYVYIYIYIVRMYASRSRTVFSRRDGRSKLNSPCTCSRTCARPRRIWIKSNYVLFCILCEYNLNPRLYRYTPKQYIIDPDARP